MSKQKSLFLEDVYQKDIPLFTAVMMIANESRFINAQSIDGFIELYEKPTSIAIEKFKDNSLEIIDQTEESV